MSNAINKISLKKGRKEKIIHCGYYRILGCPKMVSSKHIVCGSSHNEEIVDLGRCRFALSTEFPNQLSNKRILIHNERKIDILKIPFGFLHLFYVIFS